MKFRWSSKLQRKKFDGEVSVADVSVKSEKTAITVSGLPNDFEEEYKIDGIDEDAYSVEINRR